jgi:hypothetical protein
MIPFVPHIPIKEWDFSMLAAYRRPMENKVLVFLTDKNNSKQTAAIQLELVKSELFYDNAAFLFSASFNKSSFLCEQKDVCIDSVQMQDMPISDVIDVMSLHLDYLNLQQIYSSKEKFHKSSKEQYCIILKDEISDVFLQLDIWKEDTVHMSIKCIEKEIYEEYTAIGKTYRNRKNTPITDGIALCHGIVHWMQTYYEKILNLLPMLDADMDVKFLKETIKPYAYDMDEEYSASVPVESPDFSEEEIFAFSSWLAED